MAGIIVSLCGCIVGFIVAVLLYRPKPIGYLRIDESDPDDGPYLFLELSPESTPRVLKTKKYVTMIIKAEDFISHK